MRDCGLVEGSYGLLDMKVLCQLLITPTQSLEIDRLLR